MTNTRTLIHTCCLIAVLATCRPSGAEERPEINPVFSQLIPFATSVDRAEIEHIAKSGTAPTADSFSQNTLTAELLVHKILPEDRGKKLQFRYFGAPKPSDIASEMFRTIGPRQLKLRVRPVTMIHQDRITRCDAKIDGDKALGTIDFHVPKLYRGSADFTAEKKKDGWMITEFRMPTIKIHIAINDEGKWKRVKAE